MKPPLTREALIEIRDGNQRNADVKALLWEIKRLHKVILRADQLRQSIDRAWQQEAGGQLVALHNLKGLLVQEVRNLKSDP